jgi:hypothetical protein
VSRQEPSVCGSTPTPRRDARDGAR